MQATIKQGFGMVAAGMCLLEGLAPSRAFAQVVGGRPVNGACTIADGSVAPIGIGARPTECQPSGRWEDSGASVIFYNANGTPFFTTLLPTPSFQAYVISGVNSGAADIQGFPNTLINYLAPSGGTGLAAFRFYLPAMNASVLVCPPLGPPPAEPCVGSIEPPFHAGFGSITGRVVRSDGSSVGAGFVVAAYRLDQTGTPQRSVVTDATGAYTFNVTEADVLLNENRALGSLTVLSGVPIGAANN